MKHSEKLGLILPEEEDFYNINEFNENFEKLDAAHEQFEDSRCIISENTIIETYASGSRITQISDSGEEITESVYDGNDMLIEKIITTIKGSEINEVKQDLNIKDGSPEVQEVEE